MIVTRTAHSTKIRSKVSILTTIGSTTEQRAPAGHPRAATRPPPLTSVAKAADDRLVGTPAALAGDGAVSVVLSPGADETANGLGGGVALQAEPEREITHRRGRHESVVVLGRRRPIATHDAEPAPPANGRCAAGGRHR